MKARAGHAILFIGFGPVQALFRRSELLVHLDELRKMIDADIES